MPAFLRLRQVVFTNSYYSHCLYSTFTSTLLFVAYYRMSAFDVSVSELILR